MTYSKLRVEGFSDGAVVGRGEAFVVEDQASQVAVEELQGERV